MMDALFNAGLRGTVALLAAWIVTGLLRKASAELRHWIWLMALVSIASLLIPLPVPESARISLVVAPISGGTPLLSPGLSVMTESIWAAGAFLLLLRFVSGMVQLYRLEHSGKQSEADDVLVCDVGVPMTWGVMRPVILVPEYVTDWSREKQEYLILHERAHIQRRDWLWQSFARMVTAVFWFHPLVWLAASRLRAEAECAADDLVLINGAEPTTYAQQLLEVARNSKNRVSSFAVAMAREHQLNRRIETILAPGRTLGRVGIWARLGVTVSCIALAAALIACQGARVYKVAQLTIPPRVVSKIEPQYSQAARDAKLNGTVTLSLVITPEGRAEKIRVTKGFDGDLDRNAVAAIEQWRFSPGQKDGKPVHAAAVIDVNYHLE